MAPAIHYLDESADWLLEEGEEQGGSAKSLAGEGGQSESGVSATILRPPASWEWATVAVYSCSKSCAPQADEGLFVEEQVFVENE
jgi:hypothetical protein